MKFMDIALGVGAGLCVGGVMGFWGLALGAGLLMGLLMGRELAKKRDGDEKREEKG